MFYKAVCGLTLALALAAQAFYTPLQPQSTEEDEPTWMKVVVNGVEHSRESFNEYLTNGFYQSMTFWPKSDDGYVRLHYRIRDDVGKSNKIREAADTWEKETCMRFIEMDPSDKRTGSYVYVTGVPKSSCHAYVGSSAGKPSKLNLASRGCWNSAAVIAHEFGHTMGLVHDHQRSDRDKYILRTKNTKSWAHHIIKSNLFDTEMDFLSIMIGETYRQSSINGGSTLMPRDPRWLDNFGGFGVPSFMNIKLINRGYKCDELFLKKCKLSSDPCKNGGYMGPECKCLCPLGSDGNNCENYHMSYQEAAIRKKMPDNKEFTKPSVFSTVNYPKSPGRKMTQVFSFIAPKCNRVVITWLEDSDLAPGSGVPCWATSQDGRMDIMAPYVAGHGAWKKGQVMKSTGNEFFIQFHSKRWCRQSGLKGSFSYEPIPGCT